VFGEDDGKGGGDDEGSGGGEDDPPGRVIVDGRGERLDIVIRGVEKPESEKEGNAGPEPKPSRSLK
jgi:hypothetical protein